MHWCAIVCPQSDGVSHPQFPGSKHGFHDYDHNFWTLGLPVSLNQVAPTLSLIWPVRNSSFLSKFQGLIFGSTRYTNSVQFYSAPRFVFVKTMACQSQQPSDVQAESTTPGHIHMPPRNKGLEKSKKRKECKDLIYDLLIKILRAMLGGVGWPGLVSGVWICGCCFNFSRGFLQQLSVPRDQGPHEDGTAKILKCRETCQVPWHLVAILMNSNYDYEISY